MITCPAMLDVPRELVTFLAELLATERTTLAPGPGPGR